MALAYFVLLKIKRLLGFLHLEYFVLIDKDGHVRSRKDDKTLWECMMELVNTSEA